MLKQETKAYADYYNLKSNIEVLKEKKEISKAKWLEDRKFDTKLIASLIEDLVSTSKIAEFSNTFYVDDKIIYPTISDSFAHDSKEAIVLTPYVNTQTKNDVYIYKVDNNNPYGPYSNFDKNKLSHLTKTNCFVTEKKLPRLDENFKLWSKNGSTCIYAISGKTNSFERKEKEAENFIYNVIKNEPLQCIEKEINNEENNSFAKIYVIKKNRI